MIGDWIGSLDGLEIGTNVGNELGLSDGKVIGTTIGALDGFPLSTYDGKELLWSEGSTEGTADGNLEGMLPGHWQQLEIWMGSQFVHMMVQC